MTISSRMRAVGLGAGLTAVLLLAVAGASLNAQEPKGKAAKSDAPSAKRKSDPARSVPDYFGQIGLTTEQRERIYKIQGKHQTKIDELEKQIDDIQAQSLSECEAVLTDTQKKLLAQNRKEAEARKQAKAEATRAEKKKAKDEEKDKDKSEK
jgi:hypothetical protein